MYFIYMKNKGYMSYRIGLCFPTYFNALVNFIEIFAELKIGDLMG